MTLLRHTGGVNPVSVAGYYGVLWQTDGLNNQQIGGPNAPYIAAIRDRSQHTGTLQSIDLYRKADGAGSGSGYWNGTGGSWTVACQSDSAGLPSGSLISAGATVTAATPGPSNGGGSLVQRFTFGTPISDVLGTLRHFVVSNADGSPTANFVSLNCMDLSDLNPTPLQPTYLDASRAMLQNSGGGFAIDRSRYCIFALNYSDATIYGVSTYDALSGSGQAVIGGNNMVRLNFTPAHDVRIAGAHTRVYKVSGTAAALVQNLRDLTGATLLASNSTPAASVHLGNTGSGYGARYVDWTGIGPITLTAGRNYALELASTEATNKYVTFPERQGGSGFGANFAALDRFLDGNWEQTSNGSTWTQATGGTEAQPQFYFDTV